MELSVDDQPVCACAASAAQWLVLSLSEREVVGSNPPMVVHTPCRSPRLAPSYLANLSSPFTIYDIGSYSSIKAIPEITASQPATQSSTTHSKTLTLRALSHSQRQRPPNTICQRCERFLTLQTIGGAGLLKPD